MIASGGAGPPPHTLTGGASPPARHSVPFAAGRFSFPNSQFVPTAPPENLSVLPRAPPASDSRLLDALTARPIGPANMGGRITAVAVAEGDAKRMYVAAASGGVWKTTDGGARWTPVFEHQGTSSIGDVAVAPSDPDI